VRAWLAGLIRRARTQLAAGVPLLECCRELGQWLFPRKLPPGLALIAGDALAGAPVHAAYLAAHPDAEYLPDFAFVGRFRRTRRSPLTFDVASIADPHPDDLVYALPEAGAELREEQVVFYRRGADATADSLRQVPPVGLLVLGLHGEQRLSNPAPGLRLHDRVVYPSELAQLSLKGHPIVFLGACSSGHGRASAGEQLSLAHALHTAGASAVIGYGGAVSDREARHLFEGWFSRWQRMPPAAALSATVWAEHHAAAPGATARTWGLWQIRL
jgi:hypothetical protein